jgi:hypothetical protein
MIWQVEYILSTMALPVPGIYAFMSYRVTTQTEGQSPAHTKIFASYTAVFMKFCGGQSAINSASSWSAAAGSRS